MADKQVALRPLVDIDVGHPVKEFRCVPVQLSSNPGDRLLLVHSAKRFDPAMDLYDGETDSVKLTLVTGDGNVEWRIDLGPGVLPGVWFCPVFPFDLDGDSTDEIWFVDTGHEAWHLDASDPEFPMTGEQLVRLDPETGERTGTWEWPWKPDGKPAHRYRYFVLGGHVDGEPVLITAQGTYGEMKLQAWDPGMDRRWTHHIPVDAPGARGSHRTPVIDIDGDGSDELLWGERLIDIDTGEEIWCADRETWDGHSDIVAPTLDRESDNWYIYTTRETRTDQPPRVVMFDDEGKRVWSGVDSGHVHWGWTGNFENDRLAMACKQGGESEPPQGFGWEAFDGGSIDWDFPVSDTLPVDIDGDGVHEILYRSENHDEPRCGTVIAPDGTELGSVDPDVNYVQPSKLLDHPGEQIPCYTPDGRIRIWGDANAEDSPEATARYEHPYYEKARRLSAVGYNWELVAGI